MGKENVTFGGNLWLLMGQPSEMPHYTFYVLDNIVLVSCVQKGIQLYV